MSIETSKAKQDQLDALIEELSQSFYSEEELVPYADRLNEIYADGFRHFYSAFYYDIKEIMRRIMCGAEIDGVLIDNLHRLRILVEEAQENPETAQNYCNLSESLPKLVDHINLELARFQTIIQSEQRYKDLIQKNEGLERQVQQAIEEITKAKTTLQDSQHEYSELEKKLKKTSSDLDSAQTNIDETQKKAEKTEKDLQNSQREYVTILGIFAAVVLAFTGGIAYSTSVLENLHQASIYRILGISLLIGFVLFNLVYLLLSFILVITDNRNTKPDKDRRSFWAVNGILGIALVLTLIGWIYGWAEKRDQRIYRIEPSPAVTVVAQEPAEPSSPEQNATEPTND